MKNEILFAKLLASFIENNPNANQYFLYSISFVEKVVVFVYMDCARIYIVDQYNEHVKIKAYYTVNFPDKIAVMDFYIDGENRKFDFGKFLETYPIDNESTQNYEKEIKYSVIETF